MGKRKISTKKRKCPFNNDHNLRICYPKIDPMPKSPGVQESTNYIHNTIFGYCISCNAIIVNIGPTNSQGNERTPIHLPPANLLNKSIDLRDFTCANSKCTDKEGNLRNIFYYDGHSRITLKTVIFCTCCKTIYHMINNYFYPIISICGPIHIPQEKLNNIINNVLSDHYVLSEE